MTSKQHFTGAWPLLAMWMVANLVGWAAGLAASALLIQVTAAIPGVNEDRYFTYTVLLALGLATGIAQWRVMIGYLPRPIQWVGATLAGYLVCVIVMAGGNGIKLPFGLPLTGLWDDALLLMLFGIAIGVPQWWILRQHYRKAWVWVPSMAAGFLFFLWIIADPAHSLGEIILLGTIEGTLASAVPGVAFAWLVQQSLPISL